MKSATRLTTRTLLGLGLPAVLLIAQSATRLTLAQAEDIALRNHPRIKSAALSAKASEAVVKETRSAYYPTVAGNFTSAGAEKDSVVAAGAIPTSSLSSRVASGIVLNQLVTDFGRTRNLSQSARLRASAQNQATADTRAQVRVEVEQAYFEALGDEAVLKAAQASVENRRLVLRQVSALAQSLLKSTLDVRFAEVAVSQAELQLYRAENEVRASRDRLFAALGTDQAQSFELVDEPLPPALAPDPEALVAEAEKDRPDLAALSLNRDAAYRFAEAEKRLNYPSISMVGFAGGIPASQVPIRDTYSAAGINVNLPILNGGLFAARRSEAALRAQAASEDVKDLTDRIARDVRVAWLESNNAFRDLDVTARLIEEANEALRLAQVRYDTGLGSIVELNQAQLSQLSAQIAAASAKYDYLRSRAVLNYAIGALR